MKEECQSYNAASTICKSGFVQKSLCYGGGTCHACGRIFERNLPACITGEIPEHLFPVWEAHQ